MSLLYRCFLTFPCALVLFSLNQPLAAQPTNEEFIPIQSSNIDQAHTFFEQGEAAYTMGQMQEAINYWQQALALYDSPEQRAYTLGNLAIAYEKTGKYSEALAAHQTVLDIFTGLEKPSLIGQELRNLGNVYAALGDYEKAIESYQEGLKIAQEVGDSLGEGISIGNLGYIYFLQGKQDEAISMYQQGLILSRNVGDLEQESIQLLNMGLAYHSLGDIHRAKELYQQSLTVAREGSFIDLEALSLMNLGLVTAGFNQFDNAIEYFEQSFALTNANNNPILTADTLNNLGHTLLAANRLEEAEIWLRESVRVLDSLRSSELGDTYNVSIFDTQIYTYNLLTQILVESNQVESALEASEAGRTRAFSELLKSRTSDSTQRTTASISPSATPSIADIRKIAREQNATLVEYALVPEESFRVQGRQRGATSEIHIWVVQPDGTVHFRRSPIDTQTHRLEDLVKTSRAAIGVRSRGGFVSAEPEPIESNENLKTLHQLLISPIQDLLPTDPEKQIIFIPQEDLFLVPFAALMDSTGDYLIQQHTLLTAPSIEILALTQQQQAKLNSDQPLTPADLLIVGNPTMPEVWDARSGQMKSLSPLEGAGQEAIAIANLFNTSALTGAAATEQTIKQRIGSARVVHFATHGLLEYGNPQDSGVSDVPGAIALAPGQGEDGLLTSAEILETLHLQAELVVLSACDTGLGDITGDGVIGLARSLIAAGTPSVLVSLWAVPDAPTADLMLDFYKEWGEGKNKAQALRHAMLKTMEEHPDPKDWAAFTLIGEAQ